MFNKVHIAVSMALLTLGCGVHAASLSEITERALARNPEVRARMHEYLSSGYEQQAARGALRPRVDVEAYYGREWRDTPGVDYGAFNHPGASLQLRQTLWDGFATRNEIRRLSHTKATRFYELLAGTNDVAVETARAYLDVQRYRQLSQLAQDNWTVHKDLFTQIEQRVTAGVGRRVDLEQAAGRLALAQSNWLTETSNLHDVSARFERIVGEGPPFLAEPPPVITQLPKEAEVLPLAFRENPLFQAAVSNLRAARAQTDVRRSANSPTLEFRASTSAERNRQGLEGSYRDSVAQLVLNYNLYRGGSDDNRIRAAQEMYYAATETRDKVCRDIRQTTTIAWNDLRKLREQLQFLEQHALSTEKARDAYRQQFDIGQRTLLDLLDTENELFEARRALTRAKHDLRTAEFRVLGQTNRLLPTLGLAPSSVDGPTVDDPSMQPEDSAARCGMAMLPLENTAPVAPPAPIAPPPAPAPMVEPAPLPAPPEPIARPISSPSLGLNEEIGGIVGSWAAAWSSRDLGQYMGFYSQEFEPQTVGDREAWRTLRAKRLDKPSIEVGVSDIQVRQLPDGLVEARFKQKYRSHNLNDDIVKRLIFKRENERWKIVREIPGGVRATN